MLIRCFERADLVEIKVEINVRAKSLDQIEREAGEAGARVWARCIPSWLILCPRSEVSIWAGLLISAGHQFSTGEVDTGEYHGVEILAAESNRDLVYWIDRDTYPTVPAALLGDPALPRFYCQHDTAPGRAETETVHATDPRAAAERYAAIVRERYGRAGLMGLDGCGHVEILVTDPNLRTIAWRATPDGTVAPAPEEPDTLPSGGPLPAVLT